MTTSDLYLALAEEARKREEAERRVQDLENEVQRLRAASLAEKPAELLGVATAARYINKSPSYLHKDRLQKPCRIPFVQDRPAGRVSYRRSDLDSFIAAHVRGAKAA